MSRVHGTAVSDIAQRRPKLPSFSSASVTPSFSLGTSGPCPAPTHSTAGSIFAVGNDRMLKELEIPELHVTKELNAGVTLGQIALSSNEHMMFAGTAESGKPGCVRAYTFPLTGDYLEVC